MYIDVWSIIGFVIVIVGFGYAIYDEYFTKESK